MPAPPDLTVIVNDIRRTAGEVAQRSPTGHVPYGFALVPRQEPDGLTFGIVTGHGTSLPLTCGLLDGLMEEIPRFFGITRAALESVPGGEWPGALVTGLGIFLTITSEPPEATRVFHMERILSPEHLFMPLIITTDQRPPGWPR